MRAQAGNPPGEDYLTRVARLNALRKQAEEIVLADLILLPPESSRDAYPGVTEALFMDRPGSGHPPQASPKAGQPSSQARPP